MYTGPSLIPKIFHILLRFRSFKVGLVGDIEKAFLNIAVAEEHRDLMRFLWIEDLDEADPNQETYQFCRVIFGMNCSPFLLNAILDHHVTRYYSADPEVAKSILSGLYVDDWLSGEECEDKAYELYRRVKTCFATGNFNLRKCALNNEEVTKRFVKEEADDKPKGKIQVKQQDESYAKITVEHLEEAEAPNERKVLGVNWNLSEDPFVLKLGKVKEFADNVEMTKRGVLQIAAKFFDLLGFVYPDMLNFKLLLQGLCPDKFQSDCALPVTRVKHLKTWLYDIEKTKEVLVNRNYFTKSTTRDTSVVLHGFGDASKEAFGAVVYLRFETTNGISTSFVAAKSRVAPLKPMSTPRLELVATLILTRLMASVKEALSSVLQISRVHYLTDSRVVLYWIKSGKEYKQFMQNRVNE